MSSSRRAASRQRTGAILTYATKSARNRSTATISFWEIERDLTRLDRAGLPRDMLKVGDVVAFAGNPSRGKTGVSTSPIYWSPTGCEILLRGNVRAAGLPIARVSTDAIPPRTTAGRGRPSTRVLR